MDNIANTINGYVGRKVRLRVGDQDYIGMVDSVDAQTVRMTTGSERPCQITIRTEAVDAVMVFI
jgi:hypothetical protein